MNTPGFEPLVYRPALPLRWWERALKAVGWTVKPRYGAPVPYVFNRDASRIFYTYPSSGPRLHVFNTKSERRINASDVG